MIFLDTNVVAESLKSEPDQAVMSWLTRFDVELALPTVTIAEIAYGIQKIRPSERSLRLERGLSSWRRHLADRIFGLTEEAALAYGEIMGLATRRGRPMSEADGMIAAITRVNKGCLATRNLTDFSTAGIELISPWEF